MIRVLPALAAIAIAFFASGGAAPAQAQPQPPCQTSELSRAILGSDADKLCDRPSPRPDYQPNNGVPSLRHKPYIVVGEKVTAPQGRCSKAWVLHLKDPYCDDTDWRCMQFTQLERNEIPGFTKELEKAGGNDYVDDILQAAVCQTVNYSVLVKSPLLHLTIDAPSTRIDFLEVIYKYYTIRRKAPELWLKAINATNEVGETFLDYMEHRINNGAISTQATLDAAEYQIRYACARGAVFKQQVHLSCPTETGPLKKP